MFILRLGSFLTFQSFICIHQSLHLYLFFFLMIRRPPGSTLFPYTTLFRSRIAIPACMCLVPLLFCLQPASAQIAKVMDDNSGRQFFINSELPARGKLAGSSLKPHATIYLPAESSFRGDSRPALNIDRDGAEKLVREAAERHHMDPALVRAVIETESGWNAAARSHKGALGLMQLIPTTAVRFGVND